MTKNKILFIIHLPPPVHGATMVGKYIKDSKIINNSFNADFINLSTSDTLKQIGKAGIEKLINLLKIQSKVLKALISKKYDLTYVSLTTIPPGFYKDLLIVIILKVFRKTIIYHIHNKGISARQNNKLDQLLYRFTFTNTNTILLSPLLYKDIEKYVKRDDIFFCPNGIPKNTEVIKQRKGFNENSSCRLLFLSNMMAEKGIFVLLKACQLLKEKELDFECHFVGAWLNVTEEEFNKNIRIDNLTHHVFAHGSKYENEKFGFFNNAHIFVFPTFYNEESFPLVVIEAMKFGLPVISTPEGGIPDIVIDGETGFLVPQKNAAALSEKIELLINQPELRFQMGMAGKRRFNELFTLEDFENRLSKILTQTIMLNR